MKVQRNKVKTVVDAIVTTIEDYDLIMSEGQKKSKQYGKLVAEEEENIAEKIADSKKKIATLKKGIEDAGKEIKAAREMKAEVILDAKKKGIELPKGVK